MKLFTKTIDVAEIHHEIDTAQDRLLQSALQVLKKSTSDQAQRLVNISERLKQIGFTSAAEVKKAAPIAEKQKINQEQAELITYYKQTYPFLKFLTEAELDRICDKYSLVYAPVSAYIGSVPEKNLADIERAQELKSYDIVDEMIEIKSWHHVNIKSSEIRAFEANYGRVLSKSMLSKNHPEISTAIWCLSGAHVDEYTETNKSQLFIAATPDHFDTKGLTKKGKGFFNIQTIVVKDPIVFRYVRGGIQVLTKWGAEANDELLRLEIDN